MTSRMARFTPFLIFALLALGACGGGGGTTTPINGPAFNLVLYADPDTGKSPLTVSFFAIPSNGVEPYSYAWDFNGDNVIDSNAPNGFFTYTASGQAKLTVTDGASHTVSTTRTITITGPGGVQPGQALDVRFTASPQFGTVPFNVQFTSYVSGGKEPYTYAWDFENDGVFDNFTANPLFTFTKIGTKLADNQYLQFPVLKVTDSRGVSGTNLDDNNADGNPDFRIAINTLPPSGGMTVVANANPTLGQAPLTVEFTGSVTGGSGNTQYSWSFGDNITTPFTTSSLSSHTYVNSGTYLAHVTAKDTTTGETRTSQDITVQATPQQQLQLSITSDINAGQVPFEVNFSANPVNGKEPIHYTWDVFTDLTPTDPNPTATLPGTPPSLDGKAVVTPYTTQRKNPGIHFANTAGTGAPYSYVARCVATDANGSTAVSNLIRVIASPNTTYPYYFAEKGTVSAATQFPPGSGFPGIQQLPNPTPWSARANAATCSHESGISYMFGGEKLDETGAFSGLVSRGDAMYMYVPEPNGTGGGSTFGGIDCNALGGTFVRLNDGGSPAFPGQGDRNPPAVPTQRATAPVIVGSAAAVFIHEPVESNPEGAYASAHGQMPAAYPYPDDPGAGFGAGPTGIGTPIIYVLGGRVDATTPAEVRDADGNLRGMLQKYYVPFYGEQGLPFDDVPFSFQTTGNQTDSWVLDFLRPDTDQYPDPMQDPQIQDRQPDGSGTNQTMPKLPTPLYGLAAASLETGITSVPPSYPNGPYHYVFIFGGIDDHGALHKEMRWWDTSIGAQTGQANGQEQSGVFSKVVDMPVERAYGKAVVIPTSGAPAIALVGGYDKTGAGLNQIDVFQFSNPLAPNTGTWSTFNGTLPDALTACGAGYNPGGAPSEAWILAFGGWTGSKFSSATFNARLGSGGLVIREPLQVVPRRNLGSSQSGAPILQLDFNRYVLTGGVTENGSSSIVEVCGLP